MSNNRMKAVPGKVVSNKEVTQTSRPLSEAELKQQTTSSQVQVTVQNVELLKVQFLANINKTLIDLLIEMRKKNG